jgi:malonyl-CoA O-methyltransferase
MNRLTAQSMRHAFNRASSMYDRHAALPATTRATLLDRLDLLAFEPGVVLDLGAGTGHSTRSLKKRYRKSTVIALDVAYRMLLSSAPQLPWWRPFHRVCADAAHLPIRTGSVDLVYSNLMLHWAVDLDAVLREVRRVLSPRGYFTFSTLGPDTLHELRSAWAQLDDAPHVHGFLDLHDLGDALVRCGFSDPVMDVDRYTLTYPHFTALRRELKGLGAQNAHQDRARGFSGRTVLKRLESSYMSAQQADGRLPVSCEVVYGQAWCPGSNSPIRSRRGETVVPLTSLTKRRAP